MFHSEADHRKFLSLLTKQKERTPFHLPAYCLMSNHVHLVIETPEPNLGAGMQRLHGLYAQTFNERHGACGHVFQGRYGAVPVKDDAQLSTAVRYLALNPVSAGLCRDPEHWPWNSYRAVLDGSAPGWLDVQRLLAHLGAWGGEPIERYVELVRGQTP